MMAFGRHPELVKAHEGLRRITLFYPAKRLITTQHPFFAIVVQHCTLKLMGHISGVPDVDAWDEDRGARNTPARGSSPARRTNVGPVL